MQCVILFRMPDGKVDAVRGDDFGAQLEVYPSIEEAIKDTETRKLFKKVPFQIVELDEL